MSWFWTLLFLTITFSNYRTEAKDEKTSPAAVIVGAVYCDTCAQKNVLKTDHFIAGFISFIHKEFISYKNMNPDFTLLLMIQTNLTQFLFDLGASVAVECKNTSTTKPSFRHEVKTNKHGEFEVHLPYQTSKYLKKIKGCSVELISSNEPYCAIAARATSSSLRLNSREGRKYVFTAGILTFKPLIQPQICEPTIKTLTNYEKLPQFSNPTDQSFLPPFENPTANPSPDLVRSPTGQTFLPPVENTPSNSRPDLELHIPLLPELPKLPPLPELPKLPPLPGITVIPPLVPKIPGIPYLPPQHYPLPPFPFRPVPTPASNTDNGDFSSQSEAKSP